MIKPNRIKGYRQIRGLTQQEVADQLQMDKKTYLKSENGKREFTIYEARDLARILGVSIDDLFFTL